MLQNIYNWIGLNAQWLNIVVPGVICLCCFLMNIISEYSYQIFFTQHCVFLVFQMT